MRLLERLPTWFCVVLVLGVIASGWKASHLVFDTI